MKKISLVILIISTMFMSFRSYTQETDSLNVKVRIRGVVSNPEGVPVSDLMIINDATYTGVFGDPNGSFDITARRRDTLIFGSVGFRSVKICYRDSVFKAQYKLELTLHPIKIVLEQAEVFAKRDLEEIQRDIEKLGFDEKDYRVSGVSAVESPITFLYEQFSKRERSKRLVAEMENEDRKRELLKELFEKYVDFEILELSDEEFDDFIDYMHVSDEFLQRSTQYDFILFVKDRFQSYQVLKRNLEMQEEDYYYNED